MKYDANNKVRRNTLYSDLQRLGMPYRIYVTIETGVWHNLLWSMVDGVKYITDEHIEEAVNEV